MSEKLWRRFAAEIGPRLPILHVTFIGREWSCWTEPGDRLCRAEVLLLGFMAAILLIGSQNG